MDAGAKDSCEAWRICWWFITSLGQMEAVVGVCFVIVLF